MTVHAPAWRASALSRVLVASADAGVPALASRPRTPAPSKAGWSTSAKYLSSDELEGRGVGTKGLDLAADYIADAVPRDRPEDRAVRRRAVSEVQDDDRRQPGPDERAGVRRSRRPTARQPRRIELKLGEAVQSAGDRRLGQVRPAAGVRRLRHHRQGRELRRLRRRRRQGQGRHHPAARAAAGQSAQRVRRHEAIRSMPPSSARSRTPTSTARRP